MRKLKWFTLVEILIVIVIIGILIWALVPRMQSAQWRARDVARKNDLSQLQSAIVTSYSDRGQWPDIANCAVATGANYATEGTWCAITRESEVGQRIIAAWMNWVPTDPISTNTVRIVSGHELGGGSYWYAVAKKYWVNNAWFYLIAHTEVEWWSNWLECPGKSGLSGGYLTKDTDLQNVLPCATLTSTGENWCIVVPGWDCYYSNTTQLRYILVY